MDGRLTDFYNCEWFVEGHKITPQMSVSEINQVLIELRRIWNKRENNAPEKARKALSVLDEARIVFQSEQSKKQYDTQLAQQKQSQYKPIDNPQYKDSGQRNGQQNDHSFIDYYRSDLGITRAMSSSAIIAKLERTRLELQSRGAFGQSFYAKMHLIQAAEYDFRDEAAKRAYDAEWDRKNTKAPIIDPDEDRKRILNEKYQRAQSFYNDGFKGEARVTAEEALSHYKPSIDGPDLFILLSNIAKDEGQIDKAIGYVERAISSSYDNPYPYCQACLLYSVKQGTADTERYRLYANKALSCAQAKNDSWFTSVSYGLMAWSLCFREPKDISQAVQLAQKSQSSYSGGDPWGNAPKVLQEYKRIKDETVQPVKKTNQPVPIQKTPSIMSGPVMFWIVTLVIAMGIQAFVWLMWGDQIINSLFTESSSSSGLGIATGISNFVARIARGIGAWGFIICSLIGLIVYNTKWSESGRDCGYEWYHYVLSVLTSIGGSVAWALFVLFATIALILIAIGLIILIIYICASGS